MDRNYNEIGKVTSVDEGVNGHLFKNEFMIIWYIFSEIRGYQE